jgi:hypothetical protein
VAHVTRDPLRQSQRTAPQPPLPRRVSLAITDDPDVAITHPARQRAKDGPVRDYLQ